MKIFGRVWGPQPRRVPAPRARLQLEMLESRLVPYSVTGNAWIHPELVSLSFVPDGTLMSSGTGDSGYNDLFTKFNARWSTATWQAEILKGAQVWAQHANLNFAVMADNGTTSGQGDYQQGDPGMGDIRIGGFAFGTNYLGGAYYPMAANNYSIAGDINFNTKQTFNIGSTYDLQTVAMHEFGHALGLGHSVFGTIMYGSYSGIKRSLSSDDIAGIKAIYGARQHDAFEGLAGNDSFLTASLLDSLIDTTTLTAVVGNLDITTTSDVDYYTFLAPLTTSDKLVVNIESARLSLLRPTVTVYAADQTTVLGSATASSSTFTGASLTVTVNGIAAGQQFYVAVDGADSTAFGTGAYAVRLNFGSNALPEIPIPVTTELNGTPLQGGSGSAYEMYGIPGVSDGHGDGHGGCSCSACAAALAGAFYQVYAVEAGHPGSEVLVSQRTDRYSGGSADAATVSTNSSQSETSVADSSVLESVYGDDLTGVLDALVGAAAGNETTDAGVEALDSLFIELGALP